VEELGREIIKGHIPEFLENLKRTINGPHLRRQVLGSKFELFDLRSNDFAFKRQLCSEKKGKS
jgi:hypothetical protein